jgi:hypothetical protein
MTIYQFAQDIPSVNLEVLGLRKVLSLGQTGTGGNWLAKIIYFTLF